MKQNMYINSLTALIATALLLAGCSKHDGEQPAPAAQPAALDVRVEVTAQTRGVVTGTAFGHGSRINILLQDAAPIGNSYQDATQPYECRKSNDADPGIWTPTQTEGLLVNNDPANVYAHYPAVLPAGEAALSADKKSIDVTLTTSRDFGNMNTSGNFEPFYLKLKATDPDATEVFVCRQETDLMTGVGTQVSTAQGYTKTTTIQMKHALAMVIVYVKKHAQLTAAPAVTKITIQNKNGGTTTPLVQGSFALADNAFTPNANAATYTRTMSGFPIDNTRYAMLVYPATMLAGEAEMVLATDHITYTIPMPAKEWTSGRVYIYNVEISPNEAQIGTVTLTDWPQWIDKTFTLE